MKNRILTAVLFATTLFTYGQIIDDSSPLITYNGSWATNPDSRMYGSTQHGSDQLGATATFSFTGDAFELIYCSEPKAGVMGVIVDGKWLPSFNLKSDITNFKAAAHYEELGEGKHEVILVNLQSGRPTGIDYIKIIGQ